MRLRIAVIAALVLLPLAASAHLAGGSDVTVDGRILDFGHDPAEPVAGEPLTLAFNAADAASRTAIGPEEVWVRIADGDVIAFAGALRPAGKSVAYSMLAPRTGAYEVTARYAFGDESVTATFPLTVAAQAAPAPPGSVDLTPFLTLAVGLVLGLAWRNRRRSPLTSPPHDL